MKINGSKMKESHTSLKTGKMNVTKEDEKEIGMLGWVMF